MEQNIYNLQLFFYHSDSPKDNYEHMGISESLLHLLPVGLSLPKTSSKNHNSVKLPQDVSVVLFSREHAPQTWIKCKQKEKGDEKEKEKRKKKQGGEA